MAAYTDVSPHVRRISQQIMLDHSRAMDKTCLKETICEDLGWLGTLDKNMQIKILIDLIKLGGGGLMRKMYIPLVSVYHKKLLEDQAMREKTGNTAEIAHLEEIFNDKHLDDTDKYPQDHPLSIEVEKLRKKWDEIIEKSRREVFGSSKSDEKVKNEKSGKKDKNEKSGKKGKNEKSEKKDKGKKTNKKTSGKEKASQGKKKGDKASMDTVDWIQMLPIWIVKKILSYLDQKTIQNLKKVNHYWAYACDSIIKDRQARQFLDKSIEQMRKNVDPEILKQCDEDADFLEKFYSSAKRPDSPREKRFKKLMNRGAILKEMVPKVKKSQEVRTNIIRNIRPDGDIKAPLDHIAVFPRLIKEDLLLYKEYPCYLKDVNVLIEVEDNIRRQRNTLSYSLSKELSDTFSMSEANLEDW